MGCSNFQTKFQSGEGLKVLLVDKDINSLMYMSRVLEEHSYSVTTSKLAFVGLSMIFESGMEFDLIICEIDMPGMDGFEFLEQITSKADIPTLLISESEDIEVTRKALKEGACFFFQKPMAPHNLVNIWQHVLRYRFEKDQLNQGLIQRELEKYYEAMHGKGKYSFLGKMNYSHSLEMGNNFGIIGSSTAFMEKQSSSNNENENNIGGNIQLGKRTREDDGKITNSSSSSSPLGDENNNEVKKAGKPPRLYWNPTLQQKFRDAYEALGEIRATPARIKELMNEPHITPQHISSYLQKFRARIKAQKEEPTNYVMEKNSFFKAGSSLGSYPTTFNSSRVPYQFNQQLSISKPNYYKFQNPGNLVPNVFQSYHDIPKSENLMQNASLFNSMANSSNMVSDNFRQRIQGKQGLGLHPLGPISATGLFQNNFGLRNFLPERSPQVLLQEPNGGLGMAGDNIGASGSVPTRNGVAQMQEQIGGFGMMRNNIRMSQELSPQEIDTILQHFSKEDSDKDGSSPGGNVSGSSVTQPLTPHIGTTTELEGVHESSGDDVVEDDMEKFLNMSQFPANSDSDDGFIIP